MKNGFQFYSDLKFLEMKFLQKFAFLPTLFLYASWIIIEAVQNCDPIGVCDTFQVERVSADILNWQNETEIGKSGHWNNIVPQLYNLNLKFHNRSYYTGSVEITVKLVNSTNRIMMNCGNKNPSIDFTTIFIKPNCPGKEGAYAVSTKAKMVSTRCIERAIVIEREETVELKLKGVQLTPNMQYTITLPSFKGKTGSNHTPGLIESIHNDSFSLTTLFQMRTARTVLPCLDHPALKARFQFCIDHPSNVMVASNTPVQSNWSMPTHQITCFEQTPPLPTYLFTFALMQNFTSQSIQVSNGPLIEVYSPPSEMENFRWILNESIPVMHYMENITNLKFPLKQLGFVVSYTFPVWGFETFGLVSLNGKIMRAGDSITERSLSVLYHEIDHQWLGDIVTVSEWREICLQEGLAAYLEWKISADQLGVSLDDKANQIRKDLIHKHNGQYVALVRMKYQSLDDITINCNDVPPLIFHMITKQFEFEVNERMLAKLIQWRRYGNVDIDIWDKALNEVVPKEARGFMKGFMQGWFEQPGMVYLTVKKKPSSSCILIGQRFMLHGKETLPVLRMPMQVTLHSYSSSPSSPNITTVNFHPFQHGLCNISNVFLLDPDDITLTKKVYTVQMYLSVLKFQQNNPNSVSPNHLQSYIDNFCIALMDDVLPLDDDSGQPSDWVQLFQVMEKTIENSIDMSVKCDCCMKKAIGNKTADQANWEWCGCDNLRLTSFMISHHRKNSNATFTIPGRVNFV